MDLEKGKKIGNISAWVITILIVILISIRIFLEDPLLGIIFALVVALIMLKRINGQFKKNQDN